MVAVPVIVREAAPTEVPAVVLNVTVVVWPDVNVGDPNRAETPVGSPLTASATKPAKFPLPVTLRE
jgi:hypothetical protein